VLTSLLMWPIIQCSVKLFKANVYHLRPIKNCVLPTPCTSIYGLPMIHRKDADCFLKRTSQAEAHCVMTQELAKN